MVTIDTAFRAGVQHYERGELIQADRVWQQIITVAVEYPDAWELRANIASRQGDPNAAIDFMSRAIKIRPSVARYHNALSTFFSATGKLSSAAASCRRAIELEPDFAEAYYHLANVFVAQQRLGDAVKCYQQALEIRPDFIEAQLNLGTAYRILNQLADATRCYERVIKLAPDLAGVHYNLGNISLLQDRLDQAAECYRRALQRQPDYADAHYRLAQVLSRKGLRREAIASYQRAVLLKPAEGACIELGSMLLESLRLDEARACLEHARQTFPQSALVVNALGNVHQLQGQTDAAVDCFQRALSLQPDLAVALNNLGNAYKDQGLLAEAIHCYRKASALAPASVWPHSNLLHTMLFHSECTADTIQTEHRRWNEAQAAPLASCIRPYQNDRATERRLRIGYVSPDFSAHPVGRFMLPLLEMHDRKSFEILCYASVRRPDQVTERSKECVDVWRDVVTENDEQLAALIRQDQVDILVDLTMHMAHHRLLTFARKPAPVQVTYLAYCGTTGLDAIDYRLTDPYLDPPGQEEPWHSEESVHLPSYWCYRPLIGMEALQPRRVSRGKQITFGCLNNFCKVTRPTREAWSQLLQRVPDSRLLLHARDGRHRRQFLKELEELGVSSSRIAFVGSVSSSRYFETYREIDIGLDPFPYGGGTTTCDALWMGIPVVTLVGQTPVGRGGLSILSNVGLSELAAYDVGQYVAIAAELAQDPRRLAGLQRTLRGRMESSALMDAAGFTHHLEAAYRTMWRNWCNPNGLA